MHHVQPGAAAKGHNGEEHPGQAWAEMRASGPGGALHRRERAAGEAPEQGISCYLPAVFTGLVETTGIVRRRASRASGFRLEIDADLGTLQVGESVSVSGACLTVAAPDGGGFAADVSVETAERTTLGGLSPGDRVNLERALRVGDRLGGHLVSGHVDGLAVVHSVAPAGEAQRVSVTPPTELLPFIAGKGSVTLDGVSLTVNRVEGARFELMLIPHTRASTTVGEWSPGQKVNLEIDLVARYVVNYLRTAQSPASGGLEETLRRRGFLG